MRKQNYQKKIDKEANDLGYVSHDRYFKINDNDPDLIPIYISLPEPPQLDKIDGWGLKPFEQFFNKQEIPIKLINLEKRVYREMQLWHSSRPSKHTVTGAKILNKFWEIIEKEREYYDKEIEWIKKINWYITYGYWFFNKGKPTYISPVHFEFLNFWYLPDVKYLDYRDRDRKRFLFEWYTYNCRETFKILDENGCPVKELDGTYDMIDLENKLSFGTIKPKNRRSGETHGGLQWCWWGVRSYGGQYATVVSKSGNDTEKYWNDYFLPAWRKYPMFLKPMWGGNDSPSTLELKRPSNDYVSKSLDGVFYPTTSAGEKVNDGSKINFALYDEQGKQAEGGKSVDVLNRWKINKQAMVQGRVIHGFCTNPSTVEEMDAGGDLFRMMFEKSNFYVRQSNGQTIEGLFAVYQPADDGWEGFIDPWGRSVREDPSKGLIRETKDFITKYGIKTKFSYLNGIGAYNSIKNELDMLLRRGDPISLKDHRNLSRKQSLRLSDCWLGVSGDVGMPIDILDLQIAKLRQNRKEDIGYFKWKNNVPDTEVVWCSDPVNGYIEKTEEPSAIVKNKMISERYYDSVSGKLKYNRRPMYPGRYTCGVDPFGFSEDLVYETGTSKSDGSFHVLKERNPDIDVTDEIKNWDGYKLILGCRYRTGDDLFNEQVLMTCVYFGAMLYPEINKESTYKHFINRGYRGYLKYDIDPITGKIKDKPGVHMSDVKKVEGFNLAETYFRDRGHVTELYETLVEFREIRNIKQMTKKDRVASVICCLLGSQSSYGQILESMNNEKIDLSKSYLFRKKRY